MYVEKETSTNIRKQLENLQFLGWKLLISLSERRRENMVYELGFTENLRDKARQVVYVYAWSCSCRRKKELIESFIYR